MLVFALATFLSAFLLFQVQPIIARYILPWYGGSPAVWTTCMLFFQVGLLAGYAYAFLLVSRFRNRPRWQIAIHLGLLTLSLLLLPAIPSECLKPDGSGPDPVLGILLLLLQTIGLPYVIIAASGPLLQHWFYEVTPAKSPYRLYAVSNIGSLLGLLSYPVIFEPHLKLGRQAWLWSGGYGVAAGLAGLCAWRFLKRSNPAADSRGPATVDGGEERPAVYRRVLWAAFAACGSILLLAVTNQMCQDVAVVPFLWVLPLSLYLVSFIISFDHARWYWRPFWIPLATIAVGVLVYLLNQDYSDAEWPLIVQVTVYSAALFACCMICHGELARLKPHPRHLTAFYLSISFGGAVGGVCVNLVAPRIFSGYWELHAGLILAAGLTTLTLAHDLLASPRRRLVGAGGTIWIQCILILAFFLRTHISETESDTIATTRGFYGVLRVCEDDTGTPYHRRSLNHGRIRHGTQYISEEFRRQPGTYYGESSGVGVLFNHHPLRRQHLPMKVGVIGLGVGTIAAWANPGDRFCFYEINAQVADIAGTYFTYLKDCAGESSVVLGDARITLERELAAGAIQKFDALFVDAFSGDSIPVHLLTREAFNLYFRHLKPDGILLVHITNLHLDLSGPVRALARERNKTALQIVHDPDDDMENYSRWVLVTDNRKLLESVVAAGCSTPWESDKASDILWTDDFCNLLHVIDRE